MHPSRSLAAPTIAALFVFLGLVFVSEPAFAAPPDLGIVRFGNSLLSYITGPIAMVVMGFGIAIGLISAILGRPDGFRMAVVAAVAGAALLSVGEIVDWVRSAV